MISKPSILTSKKLFLILLFSLSISACGGSGTQANTNNTEDVIAEITPSDNSTGDDVANDENQPAPEVEIEIIPTALDEALALIIEDFALDRSPLANRTLPSIESPMAQLGKKLFFSKSLGGAFDTACVSCHHPMLGGADDLSLPIGVNAIDPAVLGHGRVNADNIPFVPRNSPSVFNVGLWDSGLFWDSRVESIGKEPRQNGAASGISTPDSGFGLIDENAGNNLVAAQARFPVTSSDEMKTADFETGSTNQQIRHHLAARIGDYQEGFDALAMNLWLEAFQLAFNSNESGETLITFNNIAQAIAEYERSLLFIQSPWRTYVEGDISALTEEQKSGALLFFGSPQDDGAGCGACHSGPTFSDSMHHTVGFPQIGVGKGDGVNNNDDFGREKVTGDDEDRYHFRTPSLLNVSVSAPYGHAGAYQTLEQVVRHYDNPRQQASEYVENAHWCQLDQFQSVSNCQDLYPNAEENTEFALDKLREEQNARTSQLPPIQLNDAEVAQLVAFLTSLTDPCVEDRACMTPWIADEVEDNPDNQVLIAIDNEGNLL